MSGVEYTEGVCDDGAAILADGRMITISEVLETLNASDEHRVSLRLSQDSAIRLQNTVDVLRDETSKSRALVEMLTAALDECEEYFDGRSDADFDDGMFIPNEEMKLMIVCRDALAAAKKEGF